MSPAAPPPGPTGDARFNRRRVPGEPDERCGRVLVTTCPAAWQAVLEIVPENGVGAGASALASSRAKLLERWNRLTREILPRLARAQRWPIRFDHCFMRTCLDNALGERWDRMVRRPAVRHLDEAQLARAVGHAEAIVAQPSLLAGMNRASLALRRRHPHAAGIYSSACGSAYEATPRNYLVDFATANNNKTAEIRGLCSNNQVVFDLQFPQVDVSGAGWNALPMLSDPLQYQQGRRHGGSGTLSPCARPAP